MQTSSVYHAFLMQRGKETERLREEVLKICHPQMLYLLGITTKSERTESLFSLSAVSCTSTARYFLLVLTRKSEEESFNSLQDRIENKLQHFISSTAIVLDIDRFNEWLSQGNAFAIKVKERAWVLYQEEDVLATPAGMLNEETLKRENEALFIQGMIKANGFLAGAELYKIRKEYRLSAFMLHQCTEQCLLAMLMINTGLRVNTHSIDKLIRYCSLFCYELPDVFKKNNEKEKKLYSLLNRAYIDTRYKQDYSICYEELGALTKKVETIRQLFESYSDRSGSRRIHSNDTSPKGRNSYEDRFKMNTGKV
jgi:uncharacterized protein